MRLVVDTSVFMGEVLRSKTKDLMRDRTITLVACQAASERARHEIPKRFAYMVDHRNMSRETANELLEETNKVLRKVRMVPEAWYQDRLEEARERVPRNPDNAPIVALALAIGGDYERAGIWTMNADFLGCGVPVWTTETLQTLLDRTKTRHGTSPW